MLAAILSGYLSIFLVPVFHKIIPRYQGILLALLPFSLFVYFYSFIPRLTAGISINFSYQWFNQQDTFLSFYLDGLSLYFALIFSFVAILIYIYANEYLKGNNNKYKFFIYLSAFTASFLGIILSANTISIIIFWQLTILAAYFMTTYNQHDKTFRSNALKAYFLNAAGGVALLAGFILVGIQTENYQLSELLYANIANSSYYPYILILIITGSIIISAQFPFLFWLPRITSAPIPSTAFFYSITILKAGIFIILRFSSVLGETLSWQVILMLTGGLSMIIGALLSLKQDDILKLIAYLTISTNGMIILLIGTGNESAIKSSLLLLLSHSFYIAALIMISGIIQQEVKSRKLSELYNLGKDMPIAAFVAILAVFSLAGVPPFFGYLSQISIDQINIGSPAANYIIIFFIFITRAIFIIIAIQLGYGIFISNAHKKPRPANITDTLFIFSPLTLSVGGLFFTFIYSSFLAPIINQSLSSVFGYEYLYFEVENSRNQLWVYTTIAGILAYLSRYKIFSLLYKR